MASRVAPQERVFVAYFGGAVVELLDVEPGAVEVADEVVPLGVVVVDEVVESAFDPGGVTTVVDEVELSGVVEAGGGTTTVVDDVVGAVSAFGVGVCCWQAASASNTLAATAVEIRRVI